MATRKRGIIPEIAERRGAFAVAFAALFAVSFGFLSLVGATPDTTPKTDIIQASLGATTTANTAGGRAAGQAGQRVSGVAEAPVRIVVKAVGIDVKVSNPASTAIDALDQALLSGAVRYPTSAGLGVQGTVLVFGHSSYLPIVRNQSYKAFDGIQNLKTGDTISVYSGAHEYRYGVVGVKLADANQDIIELPQTGQHLTLVTCNSFASKSNRFVVTADLVGTYPLASN